MKKIAAIAAALMLFTAFASCAEKLNESSSEPAQGNNSSQVGETAEQTAAENSTQVVSDEKNPLTGLRGYNEAAVGKRPVAIMVNNIKASLPQYGIEQADVIYEIPVEGGITRLMAVYADYTNVPDICSIRSCRYYYPILAYGMDSIYCHWGRDMTIANDTLNRLDIDNIDGSGDAYGELYFRDEAREETYATEHTGYLKGSALAETIENMGYRTDLLPDQPVSMFSFNSEENPVTPEGVACMSVDIPFSGEYYSDFEYDSTLGVYKKFHSGEPHMDSATGNQLSFTNVFVLYTEISLRGEGALVDVELSGGDGYYISDGAAQQIKWYKNDEDEPIRVTDLEGHEISVNAGKSYIGLIDDDRTVEIN